MKKRTGKNKNMRVLKSTFKIFIMVLAVITLQSCEGSNDEPDIPVSKGDVTINALSFTANTLYTMSTKDGVLKTYEFSTETPSEKLNAIIAYNGQAWCWNNNTQSLLRFQDGVVVETKKIQFLDMSRSSYYSPRVINGKCYFIGNDENNILVYDSNGSLSLVNIPNNDGYFKNDTVHSYYYRWALDIDFNIYTCGHVNNNPLWILLKNEQKLADIPFVTVYSNGLIDGEYYALGSSTNGTGAYWYSGIIVEDNNFSMITCAASLNGNLCLGGYKIDEKGVRRAVLKIGNVYLDLTSETGLYRLDNASGENVLIYPPSSVEQIVVVNNEVYSKVTRSLYRPMKGKELIPYADAIFRNGNKIVDFNDKIITGFVVTSN